MDFPAHKAALYLTHNEHKSYHQTVAERVKSADFGYTDACWVSEEQKRKAIDTDDCWTVQWYPETPVGFCILSAADLDVLLAKAKE